MGHDKKALIFGINGQDGYYLSKLLRGQDISVTGVSRSSNSYIKGDVADRFFVEQLIKSEKPEYIFHLAANSTTRHDALFENHDTISSGTLNILEAVNTYSKHSKVFISGSGLQFENKGLPIAENAPFEAKDAYSISRIQSVYASRYFRKLGIRVYVGYFFNHDSPRRSERHINQKIVQSLRRIVSGSGEIIELGNIDVEKEFSFAGDIVNGILKLVQNDQIFETVIGSGEAYPISDWLEICFGNYALNWRDHVRIKPGFIPEYGRLVSSPKTLFSLGWKPLVNINELAKMMLEADY